MTYNINKELLEMAKNKDAFKFDLKNYKASTLQELESYKSTDEAKNLANIAINTILLVGNNKGFETIEKQVKATAVKNKKTEIAELENAVTEANEAKIEEELGDILFSCTNLSRFLKKDSEKALTFAINKFIIRFSGVEALIEKEGKTFSQLSQAELDEYWERVKSNSVN